VLAGLDDHLTVEAEHDFVAANRVFDELGGIEVPVHRRDPIQADGREVVASCCEGFGNVRISLLLGWTSRARGEGFA